MSVVSRKGFDETRKEELVTYWELVEICKKEGVDPSKAHDFAKGLWNNRNVYRDAPEVPGSKSLLRILKAIEQPIIFVSSRPDVFIDTTNTWFNSTFPWIGNKDIYLGRQHSQEGGVYKSGVIQALNVQLHFEDALEEAKDIISSTEAKVIIVPQPWNLVCDFESQKMKTFSSYSADAGMWPVIRFLASPEAAEFLGRVVQS